MLTFILVRHGETDWSKSKKHTFRGQLDIPLNSKGIDQARSVGFALKNEKIDVIFSSSLIRAYDTATEIAKILNLEVFEHSGFIDLDFGDWGGKTHDEIKSIFPKLYQKWRTTPQEMEFPNGESLDVIKIRIENAINGLVEKYDSENTNKTLAIVSHGAVLRVMMCYINNLDLENSWKYSIANCSITKIELNKGKFKVIFENDISHL